MSHVPTISIQNRSLVENGYASAIMQTARPSHTTAVHTSPATIAGSAERGCPPRAPGRGGIEGTDEPHRGAGDGGGGGVSLRRISIGGCAGASSVVAAATWSSPAGTRAPGAWIGIGSVSSALRTEP